LRLIDVFAAQPALFIGACSLLGLLIGSFLNVVIHRLPVMLERQWRLECSRLAAGVQVASAEEPFNLVVPRSACPACRAPITAWQNIPILSYLALRGRCAACRAPISARYPLVEALTAVLSAAVAWRFGFGTAAGAGLVLTWFLIALTFIDLDTQYLPDNLTLPLLWLGLLVSLAGTAGAQAAIPVDLRSCVLGAVVGYLCLWSVYQLFRLATGKEGMGYGDFKLLAALGAWLGLQMLLPIVLLSALVGALVGMTLILLRRQDRGTPNPFGPFLASAGWLAMMWGPQLVARYLRLYSAGGA